MYIYIYLHILNITNVIDAVLGYPGISTPRVAAQIHIFHSFASRHFVTKNFVFIIFNIYVWVQLQSWVIA